MQFIDLINNLLARLRESSVSSINQSTYSTLLSIFLNDAKAEIEESWNWSAYRQTLSVSTTQGDYSYNLPGTQDRLTLLSALNDTSNRPITYATSEQFHTWFFINNTVSGTPSYYTFNGLDSLGDTTVDIYPIPDGVYDLRFNMVLRPTELASEGDVLLIPHQPVLLLAYAKAIEERGEDGGVASSSAYMTASKSLSDAIAIDADKHPEELIWEAT